MSNTLYFSRERDRDMCKLTYQLVTQAAAERDVPVMLKDIANDADGAQRYAHVQLPVLRMMDGSELNGRAAYDKVLDLTGYGVPPSMSRGGITPPQSGAAQPGQFTPPPMMMMTPQTGQPPVGMPGMPPMPSNAIDSVPMGLMSATVPPPPPPPLPQQQQHYAPQSQQQYAYAPPPPQAVHPRAQPSIKARYILFTDDEPSDIEIPGNGMVKVQSFAQTKINYGDTFPEFLARAADDWVDKATRQPLPVLAPLENNGKPLYGHMARDWCRLLCLIGGGRMYV